MINNETTINNETIETTKNKNPPHRPPKEKAIDPEALDRSFYTVYEVADLMHLHWQTVLRMIRAGQLPAKKYGRSWRIRVDDLMQFTTPDGTANDDENG